MSSTDVTTGTHGAGAVPGTIDMKLEVITIPVSDVDRAKSFYENLGWRLDADFDLGNGIRVVQFTPTHSNCSVSFGSGIVKAEPGSVERMEIVVSDIEAARADLIDRGVQVSEPFHRGAGASSRASTRSASRTTATPRSAIRTATAGYSRRSRRGFRAGCGRTEPWMSAR
jgi:catechol 2,3-dioxygenase-like lactoylglutathione lyase family enzyme